MSTADETTTRARNLVSLTGLPQVMGTRIAEKWL